MQYGNYSYRNPIPRLCIVTAAEIEFNAVIGQLEDKNITTELDMKICRGRAGRNDITVLQTQIGAVNFQPKFHAFLARAQIDCVYMLGLAGALSPDLKTGEVILYDTCFLFRPQQFSTGQKDMPLAADETAVCDFQLAASLRQQLVNGGAHACFGAGLTLDFMVTKAAEKLALGESYGSAAVDMESYDVIQTAAQLGKPTVVVRVILDEAQQTTPDFNLALLPNGQISVPKSLLAILMRPLAAVKFFLSLWRVMPHLRQLAKLVAQSEQPTQTAATGLVLQQKIWA